MADWLRPVFGRTKTPVLGATTTSLSDQATSASGDSNEQVSDDLIMSSRLKPTSRVSSYIGLRNSTPPVTTAEAFPNFRNPESVYHKPSGGQIAEALKVVMMTQNTMEPIPTQYNASILHLLEEHYDMRQELNTKQEIIDELKQSHANDIIEFETLTTQWEEREKDFKAEVKRLEVLLSQTEGGMEAVSLARSMSLIHGSNRASEETGRGVGTIKERHAARNDQERERVKRRRATSASQQISKQAVPTCYQNGDVGNVKPSNLIIRAEALEKRSSVPFYSRILRSQASKNSMRTPELLAEEFYSPSPSRQLLGLTRLQLEALEQQEAEEEPGVGFDSSTSGADSNSESFLDQIYGMDDRFGLGIGLREEKPLPNIPLNPMTKKPIPRYSMNDLMKPPGNKESSSKIQIPKNVSFSFQPGDDCNVLSQGEARDAHKRRLLEEHLHQICEKSDTSSQQQQRPKAFPNPEPKQQQPPRKPQNSRERLDGTSSLIRDDSSSSIVTAVRDNSGRSSLNSSRYNAGQNGTRLDRQAGSGSGSSEAVTAAARAYASTQRDGSNYLSPEPASRSGSRSQDGSVKVEIGRRKSNDDVRESKQSGRGNSRASVAYGNK